MTESVVVLVVAVVTAVVLWPGRAPVPTRRRGSTGGVGTTRGSGEIHGDRTTDRPEAGVSAAAVADALTLLAVALRSGCAPLEALDEVAARSPDDVAAQLRSVATAHRWGLEPAECWAYVPPVWGPAALAWQAALTAGVSPATLLERAGEVIRDREARRVEAALARAGVLLVLPLGLAFLPGFVATTVVPVVLHLVTGFAGLAP